jgi:hypothetical protein
MIHHREHEWHKENCTDNAARHVPRGLPLGECNNNPHIILLQRGPISVAI